MLSTPLNNNVCNRLTQIYVALAKAHKYFSVYFLLTEQLQYNVLLKGYC